MFALPEDIIPIIAAFSPLFSARVWPQAQVLLLGAILTPGKRTVSAVLRTLSLSQDPHYINYHRVLSRAVWNLLQGSRILLELILKLLPADAPVVIGADDTIERRFSKKLTGIGCYRDPVRSSKKHVIHCFGLKWVSMSVLTSLPFSSHTWSLPFLNALCEPQEKDEKAKGKKTKGKKAPPRNRPRRGANRRKPKGKPSSRLPAPASPASTGRSAGQAGKPDQSPKRTHKTSVDFLRQTCLCVLSHARRQVIKQVRRWLQKRALVLVVDGGFAVVSLALSCISINTVMVSRLRWDAALYHQPGPQGEGKRGPKPKKGSRQRKLKTWAARSDTPFVEEDIQWYGGKVKKMLLFSQTALWYTPRWDPVPIRFVITRDPEGKLRDEVFFCTNPDDTPVQIVEWIVMRFSMETTFQEARAHLRMETQRQWSHLAIKRTTPVLLSLFSIVILLAMRLQQDDSIPVQATAWYQKTEPTFSDCMLLVRRHLWEAWFLVNSTQKQEKVQFPCEILDLLCGLQLPLVA